MFKSFRSLVLITFLTLLAQAQPIILNGIDVRASSTALSKSDFEKMAGTGKGTLLLVQFSGPIHPEWLDNLKQQGVEIHNYVGSYAYFVTVPAKSVTSIRSAVAVSWVGVLPPEAKVSPNLAASVAQAAQSKQEAQSELVRVLAFDESFMKSLTPLGYTIESFRETPMGWYEARLMLPLAKVLNVANIPEVFEIEGVVQPELHGERGAQTAAGQYTPGATTLTGPGYTTWLASEGLTGGAGLIVQVQDDGLDKGIATNLPGTAHPDILGRIVGIYNPGGDPLGDSSAGHGMINAGIIMGNATVGTTDAGGYKLGQGLAPNASVYATKVFTNIGSWSLGADTLTTLAKRAQDAGAKFSSNSWGSSENGAYNSDSAEIDALARDCDTSEIGNQPMIYFFSAGNDGPADGTVDPPGTSKNVICVGAAENTDADGTDGCNVSPSGANSIRDVINFSSRGPADDGRQGVTVVATGTHVQGPASTVATYDGTGVCDKYWPTNQTAYARSSGTSHSCPTACGAGIIIYDLFKNQLSSSGHTASPSPALIRAVISNTATDLFGGNDGNGGTLAHIPNVRQGWGSVDLDRLMQMKQALYSLDQTSLFTASGATFSVSLTPVTTDEPFKISLAWTDVAGVPYAGAELVNDLDLEVDDNGLTYKGNVFTNGFSTTGGTADHTNNLEAVYIEHPSGGVVTVRVKATNIAANGVPGNASALDQDFALFGWNAKDQTSSGTISISPSEIACSGTLTATVSDADLQGDGTVSISLTSTTGDGEPLTLNESGGATGVFTNTINATTGAVAADGVLQIVNGGHITGTYHDASNMSLQAVDVTDTSVVDCTPPVVSNIQVTNLGSQNATITFTTDEPATAALHFGLSCGALTQTRTDDFPNTSHSIAVSGLTATTNYFFTISATDVAGNSATANGGSCSQFTTTAVPDYFTQVLSSALKNVSYMLTPDASISGFTICKSSASSYPVDPASHTNLVTANAMGDDAPIHLSFTDAKTFIFYGVTYNDLYVGPNGNITFGVGDSTYTETTTAHFAIPRIAALFQDFSPNATHPVYYKQLTDRAVVTWENVPQYQLTDSNQMQVELFFDGRIRITHLNTDATSGIIGLSRGQGVPADFAQSNFFNYASCSSQVTVSGTVTLQGGGALQGVTINGLTGPPTTNASGLYSALVTSGFSGTATPQLDGYSFSPTSRTYSALTTDTTAQDFVATPLAPASLGVTPANRDVSAAAGTTSFNVDNLGDFSMPWTATVTSSSDWLAITSGASGTDAGVINISFAANTIESPRSATIQITASGAANSPANVTVTQAAFVVLPPADLSVTPSNRNVTANSGTTSFTVENLGDISMPWIASVTSGSDWLSISSGSSGTNTGLVNVAFGANSTATERIATIEVTASGANNSPASVTVTQAAGQVSTNALTVATPNGGESVTLGKRYNVKWTSQGNVGANVAIELWRNDTLAKVLKASTANDGHQKCKIPANLPIGRKYKIRIVSTTNPSISDKSDGKFRLVK